MKTKTKRLAVCALACAMTAAAGVLLSGNALPANTGEAVAAGEVCSETADRRALLALLNFYMEGSDGEVRGILKNEFTLFPGIVQVQIELFSSPTYTESYEEMQLERRIYNGDLDQGEQLVARASTDGEQRYWMARTMANIDGQGNRYTVYGPYLFDGNGTLLQSWEQ